MKTALEPDFLESIFTWQTEFQLQMLELMLGEGFTIHALWYFSDLCYKNGMLFSPGFYSEVLSPLHTRVFDFCHARNIKIIYHSDGDIRQLLPLLIEAGIDCIQPMEARQGNNVIEFKKQYGSHIAFMGNINADVLGTTKEQIEHEVIPKVKAASKNGGYIFHSDHSVPPSVSLENYTHAVENARTAADF
jgi:uroporphyrinogen decarboxylase